MELQKFSFIPNYIEIAADLPFKLMPGCDIKKADEKQVKLVETNLRKMGHLVASISAGGSLPYELSYSFQKTSDEIVHIHTATLDRSQWKYYIVTYEDEGLSLLNLQFASNLADIPLVFDVFTCDVYENKYVFGYNPDLAFRFFTENDMMLQQTVRKEHLVQIKDIYSRFSSIMDEFPEIVNSIKLFNNLRFLYNYHDFKILGLFAVIESLLTHKPTSFETGDSLTRQVRTKVPLLLRRIAHRVDDNSIFNGQDESKVWKVLYDYRSALAHGRRPDFDKEFIILKNGMVVHDYLISCIKMLCLQALIEPQLVTDLKEC